MNARKKILLADDELAVRRAYGGLLQAEGYVVDTARNGREALEKCSASRPDLVLLDVMMPVMDGLSACIAIRRMDKLLPVLFFTAAASEESKVAAFGFGADDYISKSQSPGEFLARVRRALSRADAFARKLERRDANAAGLEFDPLRCMVKTGDGEAKLSRSEAVALKLLSGSPGRFFTVEELFAELRGYDYCGDVRAMRTFISRLKAKLGDLGNRITNVRGAGYAYKI